MSGAFRLVTAAVVVWLLPTVGRAEARMGALPARGAILEVVSTANSATTAYWRPQALRVRGEFAPTLYRTLAAAIPDSVLSARERAQMAWEIADVFRWQADFTRDLKAGGEFQILFERLLSPDGEIRFGRLLAAELTLRGRAIEAYEYDDATGGTAYYDQSGRSLRRSFLRVPVEFRRISSGFTSARFHPILKRWRAHQGIDYAAAPGAPVMAAGDGVVLRAGTYGAYGKLVEIRHPNGVITRYGHLKGFASGLRPGREVEQGVCIGYVGATGLATGPHLHFEFRVHGIAVDPARVESSEEDSPSAPADMVGFQREVARLKTLLAPASSFALGA